MGAEDEEIIHIDEDDATAMGVVADVDAGVTHPGNGEENMKTAKAAYWSESLIIVDAFDLRVATDNKTGLKAIDSAISMLLHFENPSSTDGFSIRRKRDEFPSVVLDEGIVFLLH